MHACMHRCYTVFSLTMYYNSMRLTDFSFVCEFQGLSLNKIQYYCKGIIISEIIIIEIIDSIYIYIYMDGCILKKRKIERTILQQHLLL